MIRRNARLACACMLALAGCQANRAPGNDTESALDPPSLAAPRTDARHVLATAELDALQPEMMNTADLRSLGASAGCRFLFTRDAFPAFAYGHDAGFLKLNGALVALPGAGDGRFASDGLEVTVASLAQDGAGGLATRGPVVRRAQLVMRAAGLREERGYRGYLACGGAP